MIKKEQFNRWMEDPVTKVFFNTVAEYSEDALNQVLEGATIYGGEKLFSMGQLIGRVNSFKDILAVSFDNVKAQKEGN